MPEGLPGFGFYHDDLSQHGMLAWNHVFNSHLVNEASGAISRLRMMHTTESANKNDIVSAAGHHGNRLRRPGGVGRALLQRAGLLAAGRQLSRHADARLGHGDRRPRLAELADRPPQHQVRRRLPVVHLAHVGLLPESRLLPVHQRIHHRVCAQRRQHRIARWPASCSDCPPRARARRAFRRWTCASGTPTATRRMRGASPRPPPSPTALRYEFMSPLVDIRYTNSNLDLSSGTPQVFIGGQNGYPQGPDVSPTARTSRRAWDWRRASRAWASSRTSPTASSIRRSI